MKTPHARVHALVLILGAALSSGCAGRQKLERIPDVPESQAVLDLLERYRHAMEARDVDALLALTSADYFDTRGTSDPQDDLDRRGLEAKLRADLDKVSSLRLDLEVLKLEFDEARKVASLEVRYDVRYQVELPAGPKWFNELDVHRMRLRQEEGGWRVIRGL